MSPLDGKGSIVTMAIAFEFRNGKSLETIPKLHLRFSCFEANDSSKRSIGQFVDNLPTVFCRVALTSARYGNYKNIVIFASSFLIDGELVDVDYTELFLGILAQPTMHEDFTYYETR